MKPLILWGGVDINPQLYFEEPLSTTDKPDNLRDNKECLQVSYAMDKGQPIIGICRGAQLLCALNGGKLDQHNPIHQNNSHNIITLDLFDEGSWFTPATIIKNVAADHHQTMIPIGLAYVWAKSPDGIPEVVWWPDTKCLAVQPHPEWMTSDHPFNVWLNKLLVELEIDHAF